MGIKNISGIVVTSVLVMLMISSNLCLALDEKIDFTKSLLVKNPITLNEGKSGRTSVTVYCSGTYDHCLAYHDTNYNTAHDASTAEYQDWLGTNQMEFGQFDNGLPGNPNWYIARYYAYFDTSSIPDNAVITSVQFSFWNCHSFESGPRPILMAFYDPSGIYPHQTLQMGDYDLDHYSDTGAGTYTINLPAGVYKTWTWNSNAYNKIKKDGWTKIMFTTQGDWQGSQSSDQDYSQMYSGDSPNPPYLTIQYTIAPPGDPSNLNAYNPTSTTIDLSWTKGSGSDKTMIRRKTGSYPTSPTDGSQAYFSTGTSTTDTGLSPGTTYYYRAWAYDSGSGQYSTGYSSDYETTTGGGQAADWTVIAYLCGDDNLGSWCQQCLNYMATVGSQNGVHIIALIDGQGGGDSRAYHVMPNNQVNIPLNQINPGWGNEVNMGDPQTLIYFSTYCINNYPSSHYLIIPQDHGGSWVGCCWDDSGDNLDIDDLKTAFQQISVVLGKKTDVVFFNDCLMNGVEIAYQLQPYVDYQAGSETISWTSTCDDEYQNILQYMVNNPGVNSQDLATYITNHQSPRDSPSYRTQCISTIELDRMQDLATAVNALAVDLYNKLSDVGYRDQIEEARTQSEYTEGPYGGQIERLIDLYDFVYRIRTLVTNPATQTLAQNVLNLIGPAGGQYGNVINRERHTQSVNFCHGMSVYFPDRLDRYDGDYLIDNDFVSDTNWDEFLGEYLNGGTGIGYGWDMAINAKGGTNGNSYFTFGEDEHATDGYDENLDVQHTTLPTDVEIYSIISTTEYVVDIKHGPDTSKMWDIYIKWKVSDSSTVELSWDSSPIPNEEYASVVLYDCVNNEQTNMLIHSSYSFEMNGGEVRHMKIICSSSDNNPPIKPQPPSGQTSGEAGVEYTYTAVTIDPDGDQISYVFSWGDGTTSQTSFMQSGQQGSASHSWTEEGSYEIKVKAVDEHGAESAWSDPLPVSMPLSQPSSQQSSSQQILLKQVMQFYQFLQNLNKIKEGNTN